MVELDGALCLDTRIEPTTFALTACAVDYDWPTWIYGNGKYFQYVNVYFGHNNSFIGGVNDALRTNAS